MIPLRDSTRSSSTPILTLALIAINVAVFLFQVSMDPYSANHFIETYGFIPGRFSWIDILTSMFLHGGWAHLIMNVWFLWIFGDNIEDILGRAKFIVFYLLCGVLAALAQAAVSTGKSALVPNIGASGAIAGVMGAYLVKFPHARVKTLFFLGLIFVLDIPAVAILGYWLLLQLFSGAGSVGEAHLGKGGVAYFAHIGGFLAGMLLILLMKPAERYSRRRDLAW